MSEFPPMIRCPHCGTFNQNTPEDRRDDCWHCQGELSPVNAPLHCRCKEIQQTDPARHFQGCPLRIDEHKAPHLVQLRLESKVAESAAKWWKVEDFLEKQAKDPDIPSDFEDTKAYALREFIVKLATG